MLEIARHISLLSRCYEKLLYTSTRIILSQCAVSSISSKWEEISTIIMYHIVLFIQRKINLIDLYYFSCTQLVRVSLNWSVCFCICFSNSSFLRSDIVLFIITCQPYHPALLCSENDSHPNVINRVSYSPLKFNQCTYTWLFHLL